MGQQSKTFTNQLLFVISQIPTSQTATPENKGNVSALHLWSLGNLFCFWYCWITI